MKYKIITAGILESLAAMSGGDGPITLFLGDPSPDHARLTKFLPMYDYSFISPSRVTPPETVPRSIPRWKWSRAWQKCSIISNLAQGT